MPAVGARRRPGAADGRARAIPACASGCGADMGPRASSWGDMWLTQLPASPPTTASRGARSLQVADMLDQDPVDVVCDLLVDEDLRGLVRLRRRQPRHAAEVREPPAVDGGQRRAADRRLPEPAHLRLLPDHPRRVRARGALPGAARRHPQDDVVPRAAPRPARPRAAAGRLQGRRGRLRREDREGAGDADPAQAVPDRHRPRDRQRPGRGRRRPAHRRAGRPRAAPRPAPRRRAPDAPASLRTAG